jgi:ribose 1,5-bisphosphate isomerase
MDTIDEIESDIKSLKIQGATNVALATLQGLRISLGRDIGDIKRIANRLAYARPTEPLAQNAVRYIFYSLTNKEKITQKIAEYESYLQEAKSTIVKNSHDLVADNGEYLTHCHSSTAVSIFKSAIVKNYKFSVYVTETRPLFQGRITAKELITSGVGKVTFLIDDAVYSLINKLAEKINAIFIGADLLSNSGFVNKVGSLGLVSEANRLHIPVYSFSTLLKYDPRQYEETLLEKRDGQEIWSEAPKGLSFFAPAFDYIPYFENVSIVTEVGILKGKEIRNQALIKYPFIKN